MGWQSDWLYSLIFDEVERIWKRAIRDGRGKFGPAPAALLIKQMNAADWQSLRCKGEIQRQWHCDGGDAEVVAADGAGEQQVMFYERGEVQFHVASDRKRVLLTYTLGPRYGRRMEFAVHGQGKKGKLTPSGKFAWQS